MAFLVLVLALLPAGAAAAGWLEISTVADGENDTIVIGGTTNLAAGNTLLVEVISASFAPTDKTEPREFAGASGTVDVEEGQPYNTWRFSIDTPLPPDTYLVTVTHAESGTEASGRFTLTDGAVTEVETPMPTTLPETTMTPPETPTGTTPTEADLPPFLTALALIVSAACVWRRR
ncbi:hypothetical protein CUJ86_10905 [Methanofollis fontis]|uniref:Uncharacterized protein n=2 Tax=Methanofollis fontis TaxID=2052832 RepID=A0A483CKG3_9EURY|nr:hypothetical protein CUJ86_10905 [Methanofollis fontis]